MVKVGEKVPEFGNITAYKAGKFTKISFKDYSGTWLVFFFYPRDFTFVCPTEIQEFAKLEPEFKSLGATILGCSTDSEWSHKAWFENDKKLKNVKYPILADTAQVVTRAFEVLQPTGEATRGTFIIDPEGILRWVVVSDNSVGRSVAETLRSLKALQTGELCPVGWEPGQKTLGKA